MEAEVIIGAFADLGSKLDRLHKAVGRAKPVYKPVGGSLVVPVAPSLPQLLIFQGSPALGRIWNILKIGIFGPDPHTAVASVSVDVYAGNNPDPNTPTFPDVILSGQAVPSVTQFSKEVEWCSSGQQIFCLLYGAGVVAGTQFEAVARVAEYNVIDVEARHIP